MRSLPLALRRAGPAAGVRSPGSKAQGALSIRVNSEGEDRRVTRVT